MPTAPCRLFVYLAPRAPIGVVLRRGPSRWTQLSIWHTDTDTFEHGQWMRGRVYERRCDVSPDGSLFAYFVRKDGARSPGLTQVDSWIAISRPPWFTALALWLLGGTYYPGAFFTTSRSICFPGRPGEPDRGTLPPWLAVTSEWPHVDRTPNWTERSVYFSRLLRDGWEAIDSTGSARMWQHPAPAANSTLVMTLESDSDFRAYGGPHIVRYVVQSSGLGELIPLGSATWADWDHSGRLVLAQSGKLFHWQSEDVLNELFDFNVLTPNPEASPEWAGTWPVAGDN